MHEERPAVSDSIATVLRHRDLSPLVRALMDEQAALVSMNLDAEYQAALAVAAAAPGSEWRYLLADAALKLGRARVAADVLTGIDVDRGSLKGSMIG